MGLAGDPAVSGWTTPFGWDAVRSQDPLNHADELDVDAPQCKPSWPSPVLDPLPPPMPAFTASPAPDLYIIGAPSLPPALEAHQPDDLQMPVVTRAYEHSEHRGPDLVGTGATRVLAAAGWLGSAGGRLGAPMM